MSRSRHPDTEPEAIPEPDSFVAAFRRRVRRRSARVYEIEFLDLGTTGELLEDSVQFGSEDPWPEARAAAGRLMDPRLQRIVSAAARGWVVVRRDGRPAAKRSRG
ncbi:hypothetical protein ENSA5_33730 [Enhygromyxa salina]|uniref:Uncharacterized protein n=1 Tax=Enhygromyxa salina TaxID=215803 RepID=A0A2S9XXM5_9BACT|nr:hypothetical protein [Enhygromyxa salina]PRP97480.1 hypothetical protein ENSA5_33730 [Enhygromyxa salina]